MKRKLFDEDQFVTSRTRRSNSADKHVIEPDNDSQQSSKENEDLGDCINCSDEK